MLPAQPYDKRYSLGLFRVIGNEALPLTPMGH